MQENAKNNEHSTSWEAIQSGMKAKAKLLILTHFSQRYKINDKTFLTIPSSDQNSIEYLKNFVALAIDHLATKLT